MLADVRACVLIVMGLGALAARAAEAAPFNAYGYRTEPGTVGLNPYVGGDPDGPWGSMFLFAGVTDWLDVAVAANGFLDSGRPEIDSWEVVPRFFPSPDHELALVGHLVAAPGGDTILGPELHLAGYPNASIGFWANVGARYTLGTPAVPQMFAWFAAEVTGDVPFFALEIDLESVGDDVEATVIPSVGVWLGRDGETGISAGWLLPLDRPAVGFGLWLWRTVDLRGQGRRRRDRPDARLPQAQES